mgnify:CR=1 FL=1
MQDLSCSAFCISSISFTVSSAISKDSFVVFDHSVKGEAESDNETEYHNNCCNDFDFKCHQKREKHKSNAYDDIADSYESAEGDHIFGGYTVIVISVKSADVARHIDSTDDA